MIEYWPMGGAGGGGGGGGMGGDWTPRDTEALVSESGVVSVLSVRSASPEAPSTASSSALSTSLASSVNVQSPEIEFNTVLLRASATTQSSASTVSRFQNFY